MEPKFNLYAVQATTHPVAPLRSWRRSDRRARLGLNTGAGLLRTRLPANATLGRAIRLILMNVGGGWPGAGDRSTQGSPAKFAYCVAERTRRPLGAVTGAGHQAEAHRGDRLRRRGARTTSTTTSPPRPAASSPTSPTPRSRWGPTWAGTSRRRSSWSSSAPSTPGPSPATASPGPTCSRFVLRERPPAARAPSCGWVACTACRTGRRGWRRHQRSGRPAAAGAVPRRHLRARRRRLRQHSAVVPNCTFSRAVSRRIDRIP